MCTDVKGSLVGKLPSYGLQNITTITKTKNGKKEKKGHEINRKKNHSKKESRKERIIERKVTNRKKRVTEQRVTRKERGHIQLMEKQKPIITLYTIT